MGYWEERAAERVLKYQADTAKERRRIQKAFTSAEAMLNRASQELFYKYVKKYHLTKAEALEILNKPVSRKAYKELQKVLEASAGTPDELRIAKAVVNANSYNFRISRLQAIKNSAKATCESLAGIELESMTDAMSRTAANTSSEIIYELQKMAGFAYKANTISPRRINQLLRNKWSGKNYSERLWINTDQLAEQLSNNLLHAMLGGKSYNTAARIISEDFDVSALNAMRLVRTEVSYISNAAELEQYQEEEVKKFQFVAILDMRTSEQCQEHDGKIYNVSEAVIGDNVPPLHPWCRSTTIPVINETLLRTLMTRAVVDEAGNVRHIPANMNYPDWLRWREAGYPPIKRDGKGGYSWEDNLETNPTAARNPNKFIDVTKEYEDNKRQAGKLNIEDGVGKDEIETAKWLQKTYGGDIKVLKAVNQNKIKTPDYMWNGKLWDLKTCTGKESIKNGIKSGLHQIEKNPGGIVLDCRNCIKSEADIYSDAKYITGRSGYFDLDIIIRQKDKTTIIRYKK